MTRSRTSEEVQGHKVVSHNLWIDARKELLAKEKEFTRLRDELSQQRRDLPWEKVDKQYVFEGPVGKETLTDLFAGKSQLVVITLCSAPTGRRAARTVRSGQTICDVNGNTWVSVQRDQCSPHSELVT